MPPSVILTRSERIAAQSRLNGRARRASCVCVCVRVCARSSRLASVVTAPGSRRPDARPDEAAPLHRHALAYEIPSKSPKTSTTPTALTTLTTLKTSPAPLIQRTVSALRLIGASIEKFEKFDKLAVRPRLVRFVRLLLNRPTGPLKRSSRLFEGHSGGVQEDDMAPSAPPLDHMDHVFGYESTSFDARNPAQFSRLVRRPRSLNFTRGL